MRLNFYSSKWTCIISLICLLIIGYLLMRMQCSSPNAHYNRQILPTNSRSSKKPISSQTDTYLSYVCDEQGPSNNHSSILRSYCSKIPVPLNGWTRASKYAENDIAFLVLAQSNSQRKSIAAVQDTWLARVTYKYFLDEISSASVTPATMDDQISSRKRVFQTLQTIYDQQTRSSHPHKWYYLGSDQTFLNVDHVLKKLDEYDHTKSFFLGSSFNSTTCMNNPENKQVVAHPSINAGLFISSKLMSSMIPELKKLNSENLSTDTDVILTCLIHKLDVKVTNVSGYWTGQNNPSAEPNAEDDKNYDPEPTHFSVISSNEMYDLDEFYSFLQIDRLVHDENWRDLTDYIRSFVANHYQTLRMKRNLSDM